MKKERKIIIVGGVAAGPKVGSKISRLCPDVEITLIEKGKFLSYAGCGLPYYVSGVVQDQKELMCTPIGTVRDPIFFHDVKNVTVFNQTEVTKVSEETKEVTIKDCLSGEEKNLSYGMPSMRCCTAINNTEFNQCLWCCYKNPRRLFNNPSWYRCGFRW